MAPWTVIAGCLCAVVIIWLVHRISAVQTHVQKPHQTRDKIWTLEKVFMGVAISIIVLSETKDLALLFEGKDFPEDVRRNFLLLSVGFILSIFLLLVAKVADTILGDD